MKKAIALSLALLFYASILPWSAESAPRGRFSYVVVDNGITLGGVSKTAWDNNVGIATRMSFNIPDVAAGDTFYPQLFDDAVTIDNVAGYASTDNVIGVLSYCQPDNVASCVRVSNSDWTITNSTSVFSTATFDNAVIPAGYVLKWTTTSAGTAANVLSVWVEIH